MSAKAPAAVQLQLYSKSAPAENVEDCGLGDAHASGVGAATGSGSAILSCLSFSATRRVHE